MKITKFLFLIVITVFYFSTTLFSQSDFNKLDENGNKNGVWKGIYEESKRPRYEGTFDHGKEIGLFTFFEDTKSRTIIATREFNSKDNSAYTIFYDQNKNKVSEGKVINKLHEGAWTYYHKASAIIMTLENYKNGKLEGLKTINFPSGNVAELTNYKNGIREGVYKKIAENGVILEESTYLNGELNGTSTFKAPDGLVVAKGMFKQGKKVGIWLFYENGKIVSKDNFDTPRKKFQKRETKRKEE
jgi:antitoxin component YwqK of YwqJK toxin-antitoxin module